ncbi:MAG: 1-(5-phosphoribosyl)-5-[(5-phosphoribosylamino)methylideneamino]imidazole-4-carboxamide isomerase [Spirochaetota bacterium]|jgi:phosphoribosylformimino-5-aminoimidazole carboxamide ribotide isomerase|nr:1-(5-phosphoribosyl)-5-[(5-phosphoribosylamino)methylideneamino]imidazole-4-carboxamide isomerase [Spirochaetota bacterium]
MLIIPAIDLRDGKCVRLYKGDYAQEKIYDDNPASRARLWEEAGAARIHIVDLDAARSGTSANIEAIRAIRDATGARLELGGGIRSREDAERIFDLGIDYVIIGTAALQNPGLVENLALQFPERILLGADARNGMIATHGWQTDSVQDVYAFARGFTDLPLAGVIFTDVDTDGTLDGPNIEAQRRMASCISLPLIASGGVSSMQDIQDLANAGIPRLQGVIVGRAVYEGRLDLAEAVQAFRLRI